jgi:hypothetical protein
MFLEEHKERNFGYRTLLFFHLAHFLNAAGTGKPCAKSQLIKVLILGCFCLDWTQEVATVLHVIELPSQDFQASFTSWLCQTLLPSTALTPSLLRDHIKQYGPTYIKSKINED